jgi:hypothetical protein
MVKTGERRGGMEGADLGIGEGELRDEVPRGAAELAGLPGGSRSRARDAAPREGFWRRARVCHERHRRRRGLERVRRVGGRGRSEGVGRAEEAGGALADPHDGELAGSAGLRH